MTRNVTQLVFLLYGLVLIFVARNIIGKLLKRKIGKRAFEKGQRGFVNAAFYLRLQDSVPPVLYWVNVMSVTTFSLCLVLHLTLGWFPFAALGMKIFNSATLLIAAFQAFSLAMADTMLRFGTPFVLYRSDENPRNGRIFYSSLADGALYGLFPLCMVLCNWIAL